MKAREWLSRGVESTDPFEALSNYWRGFNNLFAGNKQERMLISDFLFARIDEQFAYDLIGLHSNHAQFLVSQPVIDMRENGRDTSLYMHKFGVAKTAIEKLVALFMVIYQIRCNFEHGQKSPSSERDIALCKAACPFISGVLKYAA